MSAPSRLQSLMAKLYDGTPQERLAAMAQFHVYPADGSATFAEDMEVVVLRQNALIEILLEWTEASCP